MAGLLDFSSTADAPGITALQGDPGAGFVEDPGSMNYGLPAIQGAISGVVNSLGQSVQAYFNQLPVALGVAAPPAVSPLAFGGSSLGLIALVGIGVFLLARKR